MAAVQAHSAYWNSKELMRFLLDNLAGFRTVPGREVSQSGKGTMLSTLGLFTWNFFAFQSKARAKVEVEAGGTWRGTLATTVAPGGEVAVRGTVYAVTQSMIPPKGTIWKIDPAKLASATQAEGGAKEVAKGYKTVVSEGNWGQTKAIAMIHDKLYIFGTSLNVIDLASTRFMGARELGKGWDKVVAAVSDRSQGCIYAIGPSKGGLGTIWRFDEEGRAVTLMSDAKWKTAKKMVLVGDDLFVFAESIWRVDKQSGIHVEVSQGWKDTLAVAADEERIYVVTKTGMMPQSGSLHCVDLEGRSELLSNDNWGLCTAMLVFDKDSV